MSSRTYAVGLACAWREFDSLLRGRVAVRVRDGAGVRWVFLLGVVVFGAGLYGAAVGCWRAGEQALFNVVKFPLLLLGTALGNALVNGLLAPLLGLDISIRRSLELNLWSFAMAAAVLGAFAPLVGFMVWNAPSLESTTVQSVYPLILLVHVAAVAFAGIAANLRLLQQLAGLAGSARVARRVVLAWLAVNLLLGAQFGWIFRPFIGSPQLPVQFMRPDAWQGSFFEAVLWAALRLFRSLG